MVAAASAAAAKGIGRAVVMVLGVGAVATVAAGRLVGRASTCTGIEPLGWGERWGRSEQVERVIGID